MKLSSPLRGALLAFLASSLISIAQAKLGSRTSVSSAELRAVIRSRQFKPGRIGGGHLAIGNKLRRQVGDDSCPPAPLPTLACKSCTTCRDSSPSYCASPSSDPASCGICDSDRIACPNPGGAGQIAICNSGQCGVTCDKDNSYFGPGSNCRSAAISSHVTCPPPPNAAGVVGLQTMKYTVSFTDPNSRPGITCMYRTLMSNGNYGGSGMVTCQYQADIGAWRSETVLGVTNLVAPGVCPAAIPKSSTTGQFCYNQLSCTERLSIGAIVHTPTTATMSLAYTKPTVNDGGQIQCAWRATGLPDIGTSFILCWYNQRTGLATSASRSTNAGGVSFTTASCPPLRAEYRSYCLID